MDDDDDDDYIDDYDADYFDDPNENIIYDSPLEDTEAGLYFKTKMEEL